MSAIPTQVRKDVRARDNDQCVVCGGPGTDLHHRQRRREGGHGRENIILLCRDDHATVHANPKWARERGLIVSAYTEDPGRVPVRTYVNWVFLLADGGILGLRECEAVEVVDGVPMLFLQAKGWAGPVEFTGSVAYHAAYNPPPEAIELFEGEEE